MKWSSWWGSLDLDGRLRDLRGGIGRIVLRTRHSEGTHDE